MDASSARAETQTSKALGAERDLSVYMMLVDDRLNIFSVFDDLRCTPKREQDYYILTPTLAGKTWPMKRAAAKPPAQEAIKPRSRGITAGSGGTAISQP